MKRCIYGCASCVVLFLFSGPLAFSQCEGHVVLSNADRQLFVKSIYGQDAEIAAEFLAAENCGVQMLSALRQLGAAVKYSDEKVGYAFVALPKNKVLDALDIPGIAYATAPRIYKQEDLIPSRDRKISPLPVIELPFPRVATELPAGGPYFAAGEAGLTDLWKAHPEADGRGTRVAVVDGGIDLFHPAIERAKDAGGQSVPKVADIMTVAGPDENENWVTFGEPITVTNGIFTAAERTWTAPSNGTYRFGIYERTLVLGPVDNSHAKKLTLGVGVLWNEQRDRVWVNTHGDGNFSKETPLRDYSIAQEVAFFGSKSADEDNRIPFGVKIDAKQSAVYVAISNDGHGTFVSGPLAGNRLTGGLFDGAAPNAQLIDVPFGVTKSLSMLKAFARPDVDVINRSGGIARFNEDGREGFERQVLERAVAVYSKPVVSFSAGKNLLLINDFVSGEMLRRNRQVGPPYVDAMNSFVWFDPDGVVNTVLGPSASLVTMSRYLPLELEWEDGRRHTYDDTDFDPPAPAGYGIGSNNSSTIPIVTGVFVDLISEARREHVRYTAPRLYQALTTSAHVVPSFPLSEQGYGLVNAAGAWEQLKKMASGDDPANPEITSFTISRKKGGQLREVNGFSEQSPKVGVSLDGELWITKHGGYASPREYRFALRGEDGFTLVDSQTKLMPDKPVRVRFTAKVVPKWRLAFLQLIDAKAGVVMEEVPLSVEAPDVPEQVGTWVEKYEATTPPRHEEWGYVYLCEDVQAAKFTMRTPYQGPEGIAGRDLPPRFRNSHDEKTPAGRPVDAAHNLGPMETFETLFANKKAGIQEFYWENRGPHAEYATQYDEPPASDVPITGTVTVTKYAVGISKHDDRNIELTNKLADIEGRVELYDAKIQPSDLKGEGSHASVDVKRMLPEHLSEWRFAISSDLLQENSADAFLLNCTDEKNGCLVAAQGGIGKSGTTLVVANPVEGNWRIVIRTRERSNEAVEYHVREAMVMPSVTPLETSDTKHASGSTWSVALPPKQSDAQYVAFHIAGNPGPEGTQNDGAKNGVRIAFTALDSNAP